jgi:hypothetical protein
VATEFGYTDLSDYLLANGADPAALHAAETFDAPASARHMERLSQQIALLEEQVDECERRSLDAPGPHASGKQGNDA